MYRMLSIVHQKFKNIVKISLKIKIKIHESVHQKIYSYFPLSLRVESNPSIY